MKCGKETLHPIINIISITLSEWGFTLSDNVNLVHDSKHGERISVYLSMGNRIEYLIDIEYMYGQGHIAVIPISTGDYTTSSCRAVVRQFARGGNTLLRQDRAMRIIISDPDMITTIGKILFPICLDRSEIRRSIEQNHPSHMFIRFIEKYRTQLNEV
jgi:hypothetical protein